MPDRKLHLQVTAALIFKDNLVLIAQRPPESRHAGFWEFPGGKVEPGETFEQGLVREIQEELNLDIEVGPLFLSVDHDYDDFSLTLHAFFCRPRPAASLPRSDLSWRWVKIEDLAHYSLLPPDRCLEQALSAGQSPAGELWAGPDRKN